MDLTYEALLTSNRKSSNLETIEKIKKSEKPLYLYGAGRYAECIYKILLSNSIQIQGVFVDRPTESLFKNYPVKRFDEITDHNIKIDICIGHSDYSGNRYKYENHENVSHVFDFFDWYGLNWTLTRDFFAENQKKKSHWPIIFSTI